MRTFAFALALCATSGAWAAAGDTVTFNNSTKGSARSAGNLSATETYTFTIPSTTEASSGYVRLTSFAFGMNSVNDAFNTKYVTCVDYRGTTVTSAIANGSGSIVSGTKFSNNSLKQSYAFGAAGSATECILKIGEGYSFNLVDADGAKVLQRVYMEQTTDGAYSPLVQGQSATTYRATQEAVATVVASAETSAGGNWSELFTNAPADWTAASSVPVLVIVADDCSINIDTAVSAESVMFDVADGKTLTLSGANTITASSGIIVRGGTVVTSAAGRFSGTLKGDGTVVYTDSPTDITLSDNEWEGVVWLKNCNIAGLVPGNFAKANSTLRLTGVKGYFNDSGTANKNPQVSSGTLDLQDDGATKAFTVDNGWSASGITVFEKLTGSGTITCSDRDISQRYVFKDPSAFTGTINCVRTDTSGKFLRVILGDGASLNPADGTITVVAGANAKVASGVTWSADKMIVNGSLTVGSGAAVPTITTSTTAAYNLAANATIGTVNGGTLAASLFITSGTLTVADTSVASMTMPALPMQTYYNTGLLDLSGCTALTALHLDLGNSVGTGMSLSNITLPDGCTAYAKIGAVRDMSSYTSVISGATYLVTETNAEYGAGSLTVWNIPASASVSVLRLDGTIAVATVEGSSATLTSTPVISGAATDIDWDFTDGEDDDLEQKPTGVGKNADSTMTFYTDATDSTKTGVYIKHHPYITGAASFMGNNSAAMTVAVVGTMPATSNTIFLNVGSAYAQQYGLVFVTTAKANEVLIGYNYGGTVTPITTMTVPNSSTARHSYIVTKQDGDSTTTFTVYLDGIKWKTVTTASKITFPSSNSGVQVGSDFGGNIRSAGTYSAASDDVGVLNVLRVYGRIITEAEIAVYADTFPYVSPNGASSRTFATEAEDWVEATDTDWTNTDSSGDVTSDTAPTAGASVTVTASTATEITVNLASETSYEALTINGSAVTLASGGSGDIKVTGMTVIGAPVTVEYGAADFTGGPMTITEDGSITFDYSAYDISEIYTTTNITLTSDVEQNDTKVTLTAPTATYQTASLVYTSGHYEMRVTPVHEAGTELYYKSGYFGKNAGAGEEFTVVLSDGTTTAPVFPGDIVVIDSKSSQDPIYVGELPDNVSAIRIDRTTRLSSGNASIAMLDGATVTVGENGSLTIYRNWNEVHLGNVVFNGTSVSLDQNANGSVSNGQSATLSVSGAVSGTAALTISGTVNVASGGSIANTLAGSGTLAFVAEVPSSALTFGAWTGTVKLPAITSGAIIFNYYGTTNSTVHLTSMSDAWIKADNTTIDPKLYLEGNMTLSSMSQKTYTFAEIDGPGALSFATSEGSQPIAINIRKVAEGYSGTISSTLTTPVTIDELKLSSLPACDQKILSVGGTGSISLDISNIKVGESPLPAKYKVERRHEGEDGDGFYVYYNGTIFSVY